jgi:hypothetical protein
MDTAALILAPGPISGGEAAKDDMVDELFRRKGLANDPETIQQKHDCYENTRKG